MYLQKYMSIMALLDLLVNKRLYFNPLYKFEDQWEGLPTDIENAVLDQLYRSRPEWGPPEMFKDLPVLGRYVTYASCWHEAKDNSESMAMWEIYAGRRQGFCVVAWKEKLTGLMENQPNLGHFNVQYIDRSTRFAVDAPFPPLYHFAQFKDRAYNYEREYRFIMLGPVKTIEEQVEDGRVITKPSIEQSKLEHGMYLTLEPSAFIENIIISPFLQPYEQDVVNKIVNLVTGDSIIVEASRLKVG